MQFEPLRTYWYCQPDGGQWNVPVTIVAQKQLTEHNWVLIAGEKLISQYQDGIMGVMLVPENTLHANAQ